MNKYYTITLVPGTTSPGPYTIHLNQSGGTIPLLYPDLTLAQNIDRDILLAGVTIETTGIPGSIVVVNEFCDNIVTIATPNTITYKDICFIYYPPNITGMEQVELKFTQTGFDSNGIPIWTCTTASSPGFENVTTITWNSTNSIWTMNNLLYLNPNGSIVDSSSPSNANPPQSWQKIGSGGEDIVLVDCNAAKKGKQTFPVSINQPTCLCDGSFIFNVNLDNPPFSYSIDNGVTFSPSPIFTNLCSGIYSLVVLDSLGNTYYTTEIIEKPQQLTTYTISLSTTKTIPVNNTISTVNQYVTNVVVTPPLPDGATITFDLIHSNSFYSSPTSGTSILTTGTILTKNTTDINIDSTVTGNTTSVNTNAGCQTEIVYQSDINDVWSSLTITNSDTITINTTSRVDKTTTGKCVVGYSNDTFSIGNAVISGCNCCSIKIN